MGESKNGLVNCAQRLSAIKGETRQMADNKTNLLFRAQRLSAIKGETHGTSRAHLAQRKVCSTPIGYQR